MIGIGERREWEEGGGNRAEGRGMTGRRNISDDGKGQKNRRVGK
jgi:hypothetical protein